MPTRNTVRGVILDRRTTFTLYEFSRALSVEEKLIIEMVEEGVIDPIGSRDNWRFPGDALVRAQRGLRLVRDLGVNWPGAALALDLLERLERADIRGSRRRRSD